MKRVPFYLPAFLALFLATGCSQQIGPSKSELVESYTQDFEKKRTNLRLSKFDIEESENLGTKTEPEIRSRYKATFKFDPALLPEIDQKALKERGIENKDVFEIHGIAISTRSGEEWETMFRIEKEKKLFKNQ